MSDHSVTEAPRQPETAVRDVAPSQSFGDDDLAPLGVGASVIFGIQHVALDHIELVYRSERDVSFCFDSINDAVRRWEAWARAAQTKLLEEVYYSELDDDIMRFMTRQAKRESAAMISTLNLNEHETVHSTPAAEAAIGMSALLEERRPARTSSEQRLRAVIESAPVSLMVVSAEGEITAANGAALTLFGAEHLDNVRGHALTDFVLDEHRASVTAFISQVCAGGMILLEYVLSGPGDQRRTVETRAVPLLREGVTAFLGVTWDVTERRTLDEQRRAESEALQSKYEAADAALSELKSAYADLLQRHDHLAGSLTEADARLEAAAADQAILEQLRAELDALAVASTAERQHHEEVLSRRDAEYGELQAKVADFEVRGRQLADERDALTQNLGALIETEKTRYNILLEQQQKWRSVLGRACYSLKQTSDSVEDLLSTFGGRGADGALESKTESDVSSEKAGSGF